VGPEALPARSSSARALSQVQGPDTRPRGSPPEVHALPSYRWFAWLERGSQKMLWRAVSCRGRVRAGERGHQSVAMLEAGARPVLAPAGLVHRVGQSICKPGVRLVERHSGTRVRARRQARHVGRERRLPVPTALFCEHRATTQRKYRRIVDLGCGFGKSTWVLKKTFPEGRCDRRRPCSELLRLACAASRTSKRLQIRSRRRRGATGLARDQSTS